MERLTAAADSWTLHTVFCLIKFVQSSVLIHWKGKLNCFLILIYKTIFFCLCFFLIAVVYARSLTECSSCNIFQPSPIHPLPLSLHLSQKSLFMYMNIIKPLRYRCYLYSEPYIVEVLIISATGVVSVVVVVKIVKAVVVLISVDVRYFTVSLVTVWTPGQEKLLSPNICTEHSRYMYVVVAGRILTDVSVTVVDTILRN